MEGADPAILTRQDGSEILFVLSITRPWGGCQKWYRLVLTTEPPTFDSKQRFATPDAVPDPKRGYRLYGMTNGRPGEFGVALSADGENFNQSQVVMRESGTFNISVGVDPKGVWWAYYNRTDMDCVRKWGANKILPPNHLNGPPKPK